MLRWDNNENNIEKFVNVAEISDDWNEHESDDVDSTPNNLISTEDDYDDSPVYISIITGIADRPYILLTSVVLLILGVVFTLFGDFSSEYINDNMPLIIGVVASLIVQEILAARVKDTK